MKKIFYPIFLGVMLLFIVFFSACKSPTGNVVLDNGVSDNTEETQASDTATSDDNNLNKDIFAPSKPKNLEYSKNQVILRPNEVTNYMIIDNSKGISTKIYYKIDADSKVELMFFPTEEDMYKYSRQTNFKYNWYNGCGGIGKNLEGYCDVKDAGFAIKNNDGGRTVKLNYKFKVLPQ